MRVRAIAGPSVGRVWRVRLVDQHLVIEATGGVLHPRDFDSGELTVEAENESERLQLLRRRFGETRES